LNSEPIVTIPPADSLSSSSSSSSSSSLFDVKEWLSKIDIIFLDYYDQFVSNGYDKKSFLLQLKEDATGDLDNLKRIMNNDGIQMKSLTVRALTCC